MNLKQGTILQGGKYRIVRFINSGGFGCTYEAEHTMLGERVAIKEFFVKDFCNRDEATAHVTVGTQSKKGLVDKLKRKFIEEAKMLCQMQHPNIVRVSEVFEENGTAYFVMDYVDGASLKEIVDREGTLSEERAVRYIRQVAETLRYVHSQDRLHLDIKPGNIMVDNADNTILIDFGTSKQYDEVDGENTSTLIGKTPGYAPLEQMGNDVVKFMPATDIYALGATLYKLLTGITPLSATLLASGEKLEPLPRKICASTRKAITAAMNINKAKRPQNVDVFLALLGDEKKEADEATLLDMKPKTQRKSQSRAKSASNSNSTSRSTSQTAKEQQSVSPTSKKSEATTQQVRKSRSVSSTEKDVAKAQTAKKPRARTKKVAVEPEPVRSSFFLSLKEKLRGRHPFVNIVMILLIVSSGCIAIVSFLLNIGDGWWMFYYEDFVYSTCWLLICWPVCIGSIFLLKGKQNGFWIMVALIGLIVCSIPIIVYMNNMSWLDGFWGIPPLLFVFAYYGVLNIDYEWYVMEESSPIIKKTAIATWGIWIVLMLLSIPS